jgi:hypothetical protein
MPLPPRLPQQGAKPANVSQTVKAWAAQLAERAKGEAEKQLKVGQHDPANAEQQGGAANPGGYVEDFAGNVGRALDEGKRQRGAKVDEVLNRHADADFFAELAEIDRFADFTKDRKGRIKDPVSEITALNARQNRRDSGGTDPMEIQDWERASVEQRRKEAADAAGRITDPDGSVTVFDPESEGFFPPPAPKGRTRDYDHALMGQISNDANEGLKALENDRTGTAVRPPEGRSAMNARDALAEHEHLTARAKRMLAQAEQALESARRLNPHAGYAADGVERHAFSSATGTEDDQTRDFFIDELEQERDRERRDRQRTRQTTNPTATASIDKHAWDPKTGSYDPEGEITVDHASLHKWGVGRVGLDGMKNGYAAHATHPEDGTTGLISKRGPGWYVFRPSHRRQPSQNEPPRWPKFGEDWIRAREHAPIDRHAEQPGRKPYGGAPSRVDVQTPDEFLKEQTMRLPWHDKLISSLRPGQKLSVTRIDTPFGTYAVDVRPHDETDRHGAEDAPGLAAPPYAHLPEFIGRQLANGGWYSTNPLHESQLDEAYDYLSKHFPDAEMHHSAAHWGHGDRAMQVHVHRKRPGEASATPENYSHAATPAGYDHVIRRLGGGTDAHSLAWAMSEAESSRAHRHAQTLQSIDFVPGCYSRNLKILDAIASGKYRASREVIDRAAKDALADLSRSFESGDTIGAAWRHVVEDARKDALSSIDRNSIMRWTWKPTVTMEMVQRHEDGGHPMKDYPYDDAESRAERARLRNKKPDYSGEFVVDLTNPTNAKFISDQFAGKNVNAKPNQPLREGPAFTHEEEAGNQQIDGRRSRRAAFERVQEARRQRDIFDKHNEITDHEPGDLLRVDGEKAAKRMDPDSDDLAGLDPDKHFFDRLEELDRHGAEFDESHGR